MQGFGKISGGSGSRLGKLITSGGFSVEAVLKERHVGKKDSSRWYKTIDKVNHALTPRVRSS